MPGPPLTRPISLCPQTPVTARTSRDAHENFLRVSGAAALLCFVAGCASQTPTRLLRPCIRRPQARLRRRRFRNHFAACWRDGTTIARAVGVPPIVADPELNDAALHHAKYLVNNHIDAGDAVYQRRSHDRARMECQRACGIGRQSLVHRGWREVGELRDHHSRGCSLPSTELPLVDEQVARLDSIVVVDPQLAAVGFGLLLRQGRLRRDDYLSART